VNKRLQLAVRNAACTACHDVELAWSAGFFDGEGSTFATGDRLHMSIGQRHPAVLERFVSAIGVGRVRGLEKTRWEWGSSP